jgi:hypothetical protein
VDLITSRAELDRNLSRFGAYLATPGNDRDFAVELVERGICFVIADTESGPLFAPSRFLGYCDNDRHSHIHNDLKDGRDTNTALEAILAAPPEANGDLETEYKTFLRHNWSGPSAAAV